MFGERWCDDEKGVTFSSDSEFDENYSAIYLVELSHETNITYK